MSAETQVSASLITEKKTNYRFRLNLFRFFIYVVLALLLAITIVPVWLLFVNATP